MKLLYFVTLLLFSTLLLGQKLPVINRTEYLYELNPVDTSQKILTNIFVQDSCGNEIEYVSFKYSNYLPFKDQLTNDSEIENKGYRKYIYDSNCKPIEVKVLDQNKTIIKVFLYKYDKNGNEKELKIIDVQGNQISLSRFEYDTDNKLLKSSYFHKEDSLPGVTMIFYKEGKIFKELSINKEIGDTLICNYIYDINGNLIMNEWTNVEAIEKDYELSVYQNGKKIKELYIESESGDIEEYRMSYYENGLERIWAEYNFITGEIIQMTLSRYKFEK